MTSTWLVTGGAGYIGSQITKALLDENHKVVVFDDMSTGRRHFVDNRATFIEGSILKKKDLERAFFSCLKQSDSVSIMHIAGVKLAGESMENPSKYWRINVEGTVNLMEVASNFAMDCIVFSSSSSVYGNSSNGPVSESSLTDPKSTYANSKLAAERVISDFARVGNFSAVSLRYFNVAGSIDKDIADLSRANLFPAIVKAANNSEPIFVHGNDYETRDGSCIRDYLHMADLVRAHLLAAQFAKSNQSMFEVFNLGTGEGTSVFEIIEKFNLYLDKPIAIKVGPRRPGDPDSITSNAQKARSILGWVPTGSLNDMVLTAIQGRYVS
jgi:UDP-glucose 4-epimerase